MITGLALIYLFKLRIYDCNKEPELIQFAHLGNTKSWSGVSSRMCANLGCRLASVLINHKPLKVTCQPGSIQMQLGVRIVS